MLGNNIIARIFEHCGLMNRFGFNALYKEKPIIVKINKMQINIGKIKKIKKENYCQFRIKILPLHDVKLYL